MKKNRISDLDHETLKKVFAMAQEEKKPFEVLKEKFGLSESDITDFMTEKLSKDNFKI